MTFHLRTNSKKHDSTKKLENAGAIEKPGKKKGKDKERQLLLFPMTLTALLPGCSAVAQMLSLCEFPIQQEV